MDIESFRHFCLRFDGVTEEFPFGNETLVYKVEGKIFALTSLVEFASINLKCEPEQAIELRERYSCVLPGYHMNKKHWNTIMIDHSISDALLKEWITDSYLLVKPKQKKKK